LTHAADLFPHFGMQVTGTFSLPKFNENFSDGALQSDELKAQLSAQIQKFSKAI